MQIKDRTLRRGGKGRSRARGGASSACSMEALEPRLLLSTTVFADSFDTPMLDGAIWADVTGATVDDVGLAEPSAPYSLRLNGEGGDSVTSAVIDLSGYSSAALSYAYQRTGGGESPETGDDLIVDYKYGDQWIEAARHSGAGVDMDVYAPVTFDVPADAVGGSLQVRFRSIGSVGPYDDWFVDDVRIIATASSTPAPRIVESSPEGVAGPVDAVTVTFDGPMDPATFTGDDVIVVSATPELIGQWDAGTSVHDVAVGGDYAYVGVNGLKVFDITDPETPILVGELDCGGHVYEITLDGDRAYLAMGYGGFAIADIADPRHPSVLGSYDNPEGDCTNSVTRVGDDTLLAASTIGLRVFDIGDPTVPVSIVDYGISSGIRDVAVSECGYYAILATDNYGVWIMNVTNPETPVLLDDIDADGLCRDVAVSGSVAFVVDDSTLKAIDFSNPYELTVAGQAFTDQDYNEVCVSGPFAYAAGSGPGLEVYDISDISSPELISSVSGWSSSSSPTRNLVFLDDGASLKVYRVARRGAAVEQIDEAAYRVDLGAALPDGAYRVYVGPNITSSTGALMDSDGDGDGGEAFEDVYAFDFSTRTTEVADRLVFYNNSELDGYNPTANATDDFAIASDKEALLPGHKPTSANWTAYRGGVNGVMVDIDGFVGLPTCEDFAFRVAVASDGSAWAAAPEPESITLRPGEGSGGSDRLTITWVDGAVLGQWLEVTVKATARTGLADDDVFYFGNLPGDATGDGVVDLDDFVQLKRKYHSTVAPGAGADFSADGRIHLGDFNILKQHFGSRLAPTLPAPALPTVNLLAAEAISIDTRRHAATPPQNAVTRGRATRRLLRRAPGALSAEMMDDVTGTAIRSLRPGSFGI